VHPLMQHIPLWVLKWQGLQKKVIFVTVITDLTTCHPTWFVNTFETPCIISAH
jgi:1,2-diacylglycerol 3-beta-galactosyltransferase